MRGPDTPAPPLATAARRRRPLIDAAYRWRWVLLAVAIVVVVVLLAAVALAPSSEPEAQLAEHRVDLGLQDVASTPGPTSTTRSPATVDDTLAGQRVRLDLPGGTPIGVALFFHDRGADVDARMGEEWLSALVDEGWAVASSDLHGDAWGSSASSADASNLATWATRQVGLAPSLMIAEGMGALTSLNALIRSETPVACWYGVQSIVDMRTIGDVAGAEDEIAAAYGGAPSSRDNPLQNLEPLSSLADTFRIIGAESDELISNQENSQALAEGLRARDADAQYTGLPVGHDDSALFDSADLVGFAQGCRS